jgi:hypothetical protein
MKNNVLIAISQANVEPWTSIWKEGQSKTWINQYAEGIDVISFVSKDAPNLIYRLDKIHYSNRAKKYIGLWQGRLDYLTTKLISREIPNYVFDNQHSILNVDCWSTWNLLGRRLVALYDWFLKHTDYNFLYTTNSSSYIIKKNLLKLVQDFSMNDNIYAGYLMPENQEIQFVSGAGRLLSRNCVELIVNNWHNYTHNNIEDVCIGNYLRDLGVRPISLNRVQVQDLASVSALSTEVLTSEFHFRCKGLGKIRNDIEIMTTLHKRISNL